MKKRLLSILLVACMVIALLPSVSLTAEAASSVWNGTCDTSLTETARDGSSGTGYYLIDSAEKLAQVAYLSNNGNNFTGKTVLLTDDITLNSGNAGDWGSSAPSNSWTPIGNWNYNVGAQRFFGTFDGQGHTISGLYLKDALNIRGLFGYIGAGGVICNVGLVNSYLEGRQIVGGFTGYNEGIISNCWNTATVTTVATPIQYGSYIMFGGIAGGNGGTIQNCYNLGTVSNNGNPNASDFGGIAGSNRSAMKAGTVTNCYNAGTISGASSVGGIAGDTGTGYSTIQYSYSLSDPGIGTGSAKTIGCGTFAGSAATDYISLTQDSAAGYTYTYTNNANNDGTTTTPLLSALNAWVNTTANTNLCSWKTEGGYPVFDRFGVSTYGAFSVTYDYSSTAPAYASNTPANAINTLTLGNGTYTVAMAEGVTQTTTDIIVVSSGAAANITLNNVNIDISSKGYTCAFDMAGATVNLNLRGTNTLKSGIGMAGLRVPVGASLTITEQSTGSLEATAINSIGHNPGAGIGGSHAESCGTVTINGGTVTATGGADGGRGGAGIGGSCDSNWGKSGGTVTITGGTVTAKGGARGAGIGGGSNGLGGTGGNVRITGGTVIAIGGPLGGAGIGGGSGGAADVVINGGSVKAVAGSSGVPAIGTTAASYKGTLKNASGTNVVLYTFTLSGVSSATAVAALSIADSLGYTYGTTDMKTDADGMLYLYLPEGKTGANVTTAAAKTYKNESFTGNAATLYYGYPVSGTVSAGTIDASVTGLTVNLYNYTDTTFSTSIGNATTDGNGAYAISGVPNGSYLARVTGVTGSYAASVSDTITVSDSGVSGANITLTALTTQSIAVIAGSHKTAYLAGDSLDVTNLKITVTRSDNSTYEKDVTADMVSGFNSSTVVASQTLTITFDGKTNTYNISVSRAAFSGSVAPTPTLISKTDTQVTLSAVTVTGQTVEYGKNTSNTAPTQWQDGTTFTGLTAGTPYYFFARVKQTAAIEAGGISTALTVATKSAGSATAPDAPVIATGGSRPTSDTITINTVAGNEYYISTSSTPPTTWPISGGDYFKAASTGTHTFTGLTAGTKYYIHVRVAETDDAMPSASAYTAQYTLPATPLASVVSVNYTEETLTFANTYEVSGSADFSTTISSGGALQPGTTYYVRVKAASGVPASEAVSFTVSAKLEAPTATAYSYDYEDEQIIFGTAYEVYTATSGGSAVTSDSTTITPGGTLYIRAKSTASAPASSWTTITIPARPATTGLSISTSKTDKTITVAAITGAEYSKDGEATWQSSNEFTNLNANSDYDITIRYAAGSAFASDALPSVTVRTKTSAGDAPSGPTVSAQNDHAITIDTVAGYQYEITTSATAPTTWEDAETTTGTKTFSSLSAATRYYIWVRTPETDTAMPSNPGNISTYTAAATPAAGEGYTINFNAETISITSGYEVSAYSDFATTLTSGISITPGAVYYVRKAADTATTPDTPASEAVSFTVSAKPDAPIATAYSYDYEDEQIIFGTAYEVYTETSGGSAVTSGSSAITPGSTLYIRVQSTDSAPASGWTTITVPARPTTEGLSIYAISSDTTITVTEITGAEYSKDGGATWQNDNEFTGLNANSDYDITIRYAAASAFASEALPSVTVRTKTSAGDAPSGPSVSEQTDHAITIDTVAGFQYTITTSDTEPTSWGVVETNGTKTFTSLSAATRYYIWVRVAETAAAMPSDSSRISVYTAAAVPSAEGYTIDYIAETISYDSIYEITADTVALPLTIIGDGDSITDNISDYGDAAQKIYVRIKAVVDGAPAGSWTEITLPARPETPSASVSNETADNKNDGRISDVTAVMEWKAAGGAYTAVTADQALNGISGLSDGTYYVRYMAVSGTGFKSDEQVITITAGNKITVTFNSQSGSDVASITGKAYGDSITAPADPVRSGFYFAGWYKDASCTNPWTFTLDTLTGNITLFAKWSAIPTYTVTGRIVDDTSLAVEGATVRMMQGATQFGTTDVTDTYGDFAIDNVPPGIYNLVITKGTKTAIIKIEVSSGNVAIGNAALPSGNANSTLVVNGSDTPSVVVGGLDSEAGVQLADSSDPTADNVEITLIVEEKDASTATNGSEVTSSVTSAGKQVGMILAIDVSKTVNGTEDTSYSQTNGLIEIIIPLPAELQGKATYAIYRYHGGSVDAITETPNAELERIIIDRTNWTIALYAKKFSTYAIGYTNPDSGGGSGRGTATVSYSITASAGEGGSISPSGKVSVTGGSKTFTITANEGYKIANVKVDGTSVGAVNSYTFSDVGADHTIVVTFEREEAVALPYYVENDKEIFVGFALNASGTMKYIAPEGAVVLYRENPKSFNDIAGHWAKDNIDFVTERELFLGTGDGNFSPQSGMTRAMFATVIGRLYERSYGKLLKKDDHNFTDVDYNAYYETYIDWASENDIITGIGGGLFKPDREITRQEMAAILYRFAEFLNVLPSDAQKTQLNYTDAADISSWATEAAMYCQQTGIITGRSGGNLVPQGTATRAEVAAILQRFIESSVK